PRERSSRGFFVASKNLLVVFLTLSFRPTIFHFGVGFTRNRRVLFAAARSRFFLTIHIFYLRILYLLLFRFCILNLWFCLRRFFLGHSEPLDHSSQHVAVFCKAAPIPP